MRKHYLVCGGAGFIGINLCRKLVNQGHHVTVWDNLFCGNAQRLPKEVKFEAIDIRSIPETVEWYDGIFNLACPASPKNYQYDPEFTMTTCVTGTLNLLKLANKLQTPLLQASTSEVYGCAEVSPQTESYKGNVNCTGIRSCYDEGKRAAEAMCFHYARTYNTQVRVVRIFNTYGPYMDDKDGRVVSNFIGQALLCRPLTVYSGKQTRSFCYIDDMVDALLKMIHSNEGGPINLGNSNEINIRYLARTVTRLVGIKLLQTEDSDLPEDDPPQRRPDITLAKERLGWRPTTTLEDGLAKTIDYFAKTHVYALDHPQM